MAQPDRETGAAAQHVAVEQRREHAAAAARWALARRRQRVQEGSTRQDPRETQELARQWSARVVRRRSRMEGRAGPVVDRECRDQHDEELARALKGALT
eukprot:315824-Rhodomonas_salina.5